MRTLTLGSLFSGSGGFELAGLINGITPIWNSEIEPFPIRVTTKRLPQVKHYGDINTLNGAEIEPVDIITFGSPCTNLSVAGRREGLEGKESSLFFQAIRIIREMRESTNGQYPRYILWENVPGALSSSESNDFRCVLEEIVKIKDKTISVPMPEKRKWLCAGEIMGDGLSVAWRTIDAQFWGVAQRRRRIFLVADFGGKCAGKILFESEGMSGNTASSGSEGQGVAADVEKGTGAASITVLNDQGGSVINVSEDVTATLRAAEHGHQPCVMQSAGFCTEPSSRSRSVGFEDERSPTIRAGVVPGTVLAVKNSADSRPEIDESGTVQTITSRMDTEGGNVPMVMNERQYALTISENVANTLSASDYRGTQCLFENHSQDTRYVGPLETAQTVSATYGMGGNNQPFVVNETPKTLKIRSGCDGGGKGALIQEDKSATISCNNDQTVFVPKVYGICSKESNSMKSNNSNSGIYEAETSRTIDANGINPSNNQGGMAVVESTVFDAKQVTSKQNRSNPQPGDPCHTLASGNADSAVVCLQGSMIGRKDENGPNGNGLNEDVVFTINTIDRHAVAYDCRNHKADEISATLQAKNSGGHSLNYINPVVYSLDRSAYNQGKNAQFNISIQDDDTAQTVLAKGPGAVASSCSQMETEPTYTVRRLTPLECCRLQGFPDWWCAELHTEEPTDAEIDWWAHVFETHRKIIGTSSRPKSRKQIRKWLKNPYSDSAEYKLWGNGIALPCAVFVLGGIVWADSQC